MKLKSKTCFIYVTKIDVVDQNHFSIVWSDGHKMVYRLSELQKQCSCLSCTEKLKKNAKPIDATLSAYHLKSVGNYALKIHFKEGCSKGIYTYNFLRNFKPSNPQ